MKPPLLLLDDEADVELREERRSPLLSEVRVVASLVG